MAPQGSKAKLRNELPRWILFPLEALEELTPRVYEELRCIAGHHMQNERQAAAYKPRLWRSGKLRWSEL